MAPNLCQGVLPSGSSDNKPFNRLTHMPKKYPSLLAYWWKEVEN